MSIISTIKESLMIQERLQRLRLKMVLAILSKKTNSERCNTSTASLFSAIESFNKSMIKEVVYPPHYKVGPRAHEVGVEAFTPIILFATLGIKHTNQ